MSRVRAQVDRLLEQMRPARAREVWYRDRGLDGDGLAYRVGSDAAGLTPDQYDALPDDADRLLVELVDEGDP